MGLRNRNEEMESRIIGLSFYSKYYIGNTQKQLCAGRDLQRNCQRSPLCVSELCFYHWVNGSACFDTLIEEGVIPKATKLKLVLDGYYEI